MTKSMVFNIQKFSVHDGPGIRSIVFFKGCPLSCKWCSNPESQKFTPELGFYPDKCIGCGRCIDVCSAGVISRVENRILFDRNGCLNCCSCVDVCPTKARERFGKEMSSKEIAAKVDKDEVFYQTSGGGITFSGGEPLLETDQIKELAAYYHDKGLSVAVETCGCVPWENFEKLRGCIDFLLFDLKFVSEDKHVKYCGGSNSMILDNLRKAVKTFYTSIRIPVIPGINAADDEIDKMADFINEIASDVKQVHCLPYHNFAISKYESLGKEYELTDVEVPSEEFMENLKNRFEKYGIQILIGGQQPVN